MDCLCVIVTFGVPLGAERLRESFREFADVVVVSTSPAGAAIADLALDNVGYGAAANAGYGLRSTEAHRWIAVLNDDLNIEPDVAQRSLERLRSLPDQVAMWSFTGECRANHPPRKGHVSERPPNGAFLAIRAPVFRTLGGFDARFFLYSEEIDLWLRLDSQSVAGSQLCVGIVHVGSGSSNDRAAAWMELGRSTALLMRKHRYVSRGLARIVASTIWISVRRAKPHWGLPYGAGFLVGLIAPGFEGIARRSFGAAPRHVRSSYVVD